METSGPLRVFDGKRILITGGTGSLGKTLVRRFLDGSAGKPGEDHRPLTRRGKAACHAHGVPAQSGGHRRNHLSQFSGELEFRIGDVRDIHCVAQALRDVDIVFNAAALKQVPTCEYFPYEAVRTNIEGPENIIRAIQEQRLPIETVVGVSTDKACKPVNAMGMTKALQERVFIQANIRCPHTRFVCVRYGNVLASRGSVIPLFHDQIRNGGPVTITTPDMTRFLLSLNDAVDVIFAAVRNWRCRGNLHSARSLGAGRAHRHGAHRRPAHRNQNRWNPPGRKGARNSGQRGGSASHRRARRVLRDSPDAARAAPP